MMKMAMAMIIQYDCLNQCMQLMNKHNASKNYIRKLYHEKKWETVMWTGHMIRMDNQLIYLSHALCNDMTMNGRWNNIFTPWNVLLLVLKQMMESPIPPIPWLILMVCHCKKRPPTQLGREFMTTFRNHSSETITLVQSNQSLLLMLQHHFGVCGQFSNHTTISYHQERQG